jgi:phosphate-selective porin OprO and OprP
MFMQKKLILASISMLILSICVHNTLLAQTNLNDSLTLNNTPPSSSTKPTSKRTDPYFSFKNGLGFAAPDSLFSMNIRFRVQSRVLMTTISESNLSPAGWEARVRRMRLSFTGHVVDPRLTYYIQLSFSRGDMDWSVADVTTQNVSPNVLRDAMVFYRPVPNLQLAMGQGKLPGNRQRVVSSGSLQFADRSIVNGAFTLDRDFGVFANYILHGTSSPFKAIIKTAISSGEGRNSISSNSGLAYTSRLELLPMGDFTDAGDYFEGDVAREEKPKLSLAAGYHFNDLAVRTQGQLGRDLYAPRSTTAFIADALFKYKGLAISSEYLSRNSIQDPITKNSAGAIRNVLVGSGINTQLSYCFKSRWEIAARHSVITPSESIYAQQNQVTEIGLGVNKYLMKHKTKLQFNIFSHVEKNLATNANGLKNLFAVFQIELGI